MRFALVLAVLALTLVGCKKDEANLADAKSAEIVDATDVAPAPADVTVTPELKVVPDTAPAVEVLAPADVAPMVDVPKAKDVATLDAPPVPDVKPTPDVPSE